MFTQLWRDLKKAPSRTDKVLILIWYALVVYIAVMFLRAMACIALGIRELISRSGEFHAMIEHACRVLLAPASFWP